jgi:flagella basal body P-ring formation protein FlgA
VAGDDGVRGEVITVKNLRSGEQVQGIVRSAKSVEVLLQ